ncbi:hypothetical protein D3C78_1161570 [compost metagenome]
MLAGSLDGAGQVIGVHRKIADPSIGTPHGLEDRTQPGFLAIASQQAHGAGKVFATGQRRLEANLELIGSQIRRDQLIHRPANQVLALVAHLVEEILIDRLNPSIGIQGEAKHFAIQAFLDLRKAGQFLAKSQ